MKYGAETGSIVNHAISGASSAPFVNGPATVLYWTDRHAYTVIKAEGKKIAIQRDRVRLVSGSAASEQQSWECTPDPEGAVLELVWRWNAWRRVADSFTKNIKNRWQGLVCRHSKPGKLF